MGNFEVGLFGVMLFLVLGILALIATSSDVSQSNNVESITDVPTLLKEVSSMPVESASVSSQVPAPEFEDVPEMIVKKEPKSEPESEPKVIAEPSLVEVSIPTGSAVPGCEEDNACYIPFSVTINVDDTVLWSNDDTAAHTVTSGTPSEGPNGFFDSSIFMSSTTFEHTFTESGTFDYFCMVHPWMTGQVLVS